MIEDSQVSVACDAFRLPADPSARTFLGGAGGYSGAQLWRVNDVGGTRCVRRWPSAYPNRSQLTLIHQAITHVHAAGADFVSDYRATSDGKTMVALGDHLWEAGRWMPGRPAERPIGERKMSAAATAVGVFHEAMASCRSPETGSQLTTSPGIKRRLAMLQHWQKRTPRDTITQARARGVDAAIVAMIPDFINQFQRVSRQLEGLLQHWSQVPIMLSFCLRDIREEHVLFTGDRVTGIIDYGSMGWENQSADLARLLGSMDDIDPSVWTKGLDAFANHSRLSQTEIDMSRVFHVANVVLSGLQWLEWLAYEGRIFSPTNLVQDRLRRLLASLMHLQLERWTDRSIGH